MVVVTIIGVISVILIPNYKSSADQFALERSAHKLAQDIRRASEMAMSTKRLGAQIPPGGYGVCFTVRERGMMGFGGDEETFLCGPDDRNYSLYADINNYRFNVDGQDQIIETLELEKKVYLKKVEPPTGFLPATFSLVSINFTPPSPLVTIRLLDSQGQTVASYNSFKIVLALENNPSKEKKILVEKSGLITVE
jgi:type II secretory pathway pseudopilin PulG